MIRPSTLLDLPKCRTGSEPKPYHAAFQKCSHLSGSGFCGKNTCVMIAGTYEISSFVRISFASPKSACSFHPLGRVASFFALSTSAMFVDLRQFPLGVFFLGIRDMPGMFVLQLPGEQFFRRTPFVVSQGLFREGEKFKQIAIAVWPILALDRLAIKFGQFFRISPNPRG